VVPASHRFTVAKRASWRTAVLAFGELCVTAGAVVLLFVAYLLWGTAMVAGQHQRAFAAELQRGWGAQSQQAWQNHHGGLPRALRIHLVTGQPFAFIRIPRFGRAWRFAIVQGTSLDQLALGPGHVPGTALPGQLGNFAVAAHRVTAGNPFYHLPDLRPGDKILIDTSVITYVYQVSRTERVLPNDTSVLDPVPGHPREHPDQAMITLITCDPPWTGTHRIIVFGTLAHEVPRTPAQHERGAGR
jgi:sortase A